MSQPRVAASLAVMLLLAGAVRAQEATGPKVFEEEGEASYYGSELEGKKTASGERFDPDELTAAHPSLPLGSKATVTNEENGKKVEVEINDRGPYAKGREIDLSREAAEKLDLIEEGTAEVTIEATESQVEEAIDKPSETPKVEEQLKEARQEAAQEGTPQPKVPIDLEPPARALAGGD